MRSPPDEAYERELLAKIERKDERALRELHRLYHRRIYAFAMRHLRKPEEAETVVSDTLFEVWKNATRFRGESLFRTWLLGIAYKKILMTFRGRDPAHAELDEQTPDQGLGSFEIFAQKELREGLLRCMEALSAAHRECLHLVFFEELTLREVSEIQGCPEVTARTRLFHARKNIKVCVGKLLEYGDERKKSGTQH
jgi:RNA polymerase sigma-70 factor, ECF subfamily